jgi:lipopolysaccharide transport system permease protein
LRKIKKNSAQPCAFSERLCVENKKNKNQMSQTSQPKYRLIIEPGRSEKNYWSDLLRFKDLFYILTWRDLKVRYKQTVLGVAWSVIRPLLTMIIFTIVFEKAAGLKADDPSVPYALFVMAGILPWQFFANALGESSNSLLGNANLISKVYFPRLIIPASAVITSLVDFFVSFALMLLLFVYFGYLPSEKMIFLPIFIILAFFAAFGIGLYITALNVKYRDFRYIIPFIIQFGLYLTPVGFGSQTLVSKLPPFFQKIYLLNPMVGIVDGFRWCFFDNTPLSIEAVSYAVVTTTFFMVVGVYIFRKMEKQFADLI